MISGRSSQMVAAVRQEAERHVVGADPVESELYRRLEGDYGRGQVTRGYGDNNFTTDVGGRAHKIPVEEVVGHRRNIREEMAAEAQAGGQEEEGKKKGPPLAALVPLAIPFLMNDDEKKRKGVKDQRGEYQQPSYLPPGLGL